MTNFEQAFSDTERAADAASESARLLTNRARALAKAAKTGNIAHIRREQANLNSAMVALNQEVDNANSVWPFQDEDEERYLQDGYVGELTAAAREKSLQIHKQDDDLVVYPSIVRIDPGDRAVRIDGKKDSNIRPSHLVKTLLDNQKKTGRFRPNQILESLYAVYSQIVSETKPSGEMAVTGGRVVPLARIYNLLIAFPGIRRDYRRTEFAFNLYAIETEGPRVTRRGFRVDFPSSTGTRRRRASDLFQCIAPDGQRITYYGIRFSEDAG